jgi:hypothetical protein
VLHLCLACCSLRSCRGVTQRNTKRACAFECSGADVHCVCETFGGRWRQQRNQCLSLLRRCAGGAACSGDRCVMVVAATASLTPRDARNTRRVTRVRLCMSHVIKRSTKLRYSVFVSVLVLISILLCGRNDTLLIRPKRQTLRPVSGSARRRVRRANTQSQRAYRHPMARSLHLLRLHHCTSQLPLSAAQLHRKPQYAGAQRWRNRCLTALLSHPTTAATRPLPMPIASHS